MRCSDVEMKDESNVSTSFYISTNSISFLWKFKFLLFFCFFIYVPFFNPFLFKYRQKYWKISWLIILSITIQIPAKMQITPLQLKETLNGKRKKELTKLKRRLLNYKMTKIEMNGLWQQKTIMREKINII
jgi:hypothetical protein